VKQGPELGIAFQNNVCTTAAIATIRSAFGRKFIPQKMFNASATVATATKYPYIINKVLFHARGKDSFLKIELAY
jgi:hypothetical protein